MEHEHTYYSCDPALPRRLAMFRSARRATLLVRPESEGAGDQLREELSHRPTARRNTHPHRDRRARSVDRVRGEVCLPPRLVSLTLPRVTSLPRRDRTHEEHPATKQNPRS